MMEDIQRIASDIALNRVVLMIGPDVSIYTANPEQEIFHLKSLLNDGLQRCRASRWINDDEFKSVSQKLDDSSAEQSDYSSVAHRIRACFASDSVDGNGCGKWLRETVGSSSVEKPELIQAIGDFGCPILTTNYDSLFEGVLNKKATVWDDFNTSEIDNAGENLKDCILHVCGHFEDPNSIVFQLRSDDCIHGNELQTSKLKTFLSTKAILLIGYGVGNSASMLSYLLQWIHKMREENSPPIYHLVQSNQNENRLMQVHDMTSSQHIRRIEYGNTLADLLSLTRGLRALSLVIRKNLAFASQRKAIRDKYLHYLIKEYGHVSIFGYADSRINLPLESVYVELKFDPTHPSIKAMKSLEVNEEFRRKLFSHGFFTENERQKLNKAIIERHARNPETLSRDFIVDQWLNVLLSNRNIFSEDEATEIKTKVNRLKRSILEENSFKEAKQYRIQQAYNDFKHFVVLGHPGSGKTTLSKWLVMNMAKQCLGETNMLFDGTFSGREKIPILIPLWKYFEQQQQNCHRQKKALLQFIYENTLLNSTLFTDEEREELSLVIVEGLMRGDILVIFEGLDEVPAHVDRADLMKEINALLERGIDYDSTSDQLIYSAYEQKEINNTKNPDIGNRYIVTSRIEGNYFEDINFYVPRLTIEDMSNEALKLFCNSYMDCINNLSITMNSSVHVYKRDQLYNDIAQHNDIFQLAINPQLASVIAALYHQSEGQLPQKRIDLYEKAIEQMIDRLVDSHMKSTKDDADTEFELHPIMLWSILQEIAHYLHSIVEGLSETVLRDIIIKYFLDYRQQTGDRPEIEIEVIITKLVDMFKYQVGLFNEFGHNSFRFIHRTFQEYLAAKSIIYQNGIERSEDAIYDSIKSKICIPNWRVPLSMTFGLLSQSVRDQPLSDNIIARLLKNEQSSSNTQFSTLLVPFVIIDSLSDIYFLSKDTETELIRKLADMLLSDYSNMSGFSRLKEHQDLIQSYFFKLKQSYDNTVADWFITKMKDEEKLAACANIIYQLKWYHPTFHDILLKNLHHDSVLWDWPIDLILRFYASEIADEAVLVQLKFRNVLRRNPRLVEYISNDNDWLRLVVALYGGYKNYATQKSIVEYHEIAQFLALSENQRAPFILYYQEVWGKDEPAYEMAVHLDSTVPKNLWTEKPTFRCEDVYKESFLTVPILRRLRKQRCPADLIPQLRQYITDQTLDTSDINDAFLSLIALGDFDFLNKFSKDARGLSKENLANRIEQVMYTLKDPVARWSSDMTEYLLAVQNDMKMNPSKYALSFSDYCKMYLLLIAKSGGLPVDTWELAETTDDLQDKCNLYAEYFASKLTGASDDFPGQVAEISEKLNESGIPDQILESFFKISSTCQMYRPVRTYTWPLDVFNFKSKDVEDIPITFLNCLENMHTNTPHLIDAVSSVFMMDLLLVRNPELIPSLTLLHFGIMSTNVDRLTIFTNLMPGLIESGNMQEYLFEKIQQMNNCYFKARALYQLAEFYDDRAHELLNASFALTKGIHKPTWKFQVLEKIYNLIHYKEPQEKIFIQQILNELIITFYKIRRPYDRVIAAIRLSFYGSEEFRKDYLLKALEILVQKIDDDGDKVSLLVKMAPIMSLFPDLQARLHQLFEELPNKLHRYFVRSFYGGILNSDRLHNKMFSLTKNLFSQPANGTDDERTGIESKYTELQALFLLFGQFHDMNLLIHENESTEQLWINLLNNNDLCSNTERLVEIGLKSEFLLTPQIAIVIDELIVQGKEEMISLLFPYIIKPSNEVLPLVQRWFTNSRNQSTKAFAALLLTESKHIFEPAVDILIDLLSSDNDQLRYRTQGLFQHPERDVNEPAKRLSVIGYKTFMKIFENTLMRDHLPRVRAYLGTFNYDILWDDPVVFQRMLEHVTRVNETNTNFEREMCLFNRIHFMHDHLWDYIFQTLHTSPSPLYVEQLLYSMMRLSQRDQITPENWNQFARILSVTDTSQFKEQLLSTHRDIEIMQIIIDNVCIMPMIDDERYFEMLQSKLINEVTVNVSQLSLYTYDQAKTIGQCNMHVSRDLSEAISNLVDGVSLNMTIISNLIRWLILNIATLEDFMSLSLPLLISDCLLSLTSGCVQKDDYLYRKVTNSQSFDKIQFIKLLEKMLHKHPYFPARGSAFILLAGLDIPDHRAIMNAMNALFDENLVKEYSVVGIPLIQLSPNHFVDDLLESLDNDSAIKTYEILKIFTQYALNEKLDESSKSKILNYLGKEIGTLKSKKPVNYYYTDIKIPFTTTLENELYKAWIKIQGLSGKTQYTANARRSDRR